VPNIILIGMPGVGKTIIAKSIAKVLLEYKHCDIDRYIELANGLTVNQLFIQYGETGFREIEYSILVEICVLNNMIISTGGGIVSNTQGFQFLSKIDNSIIVYLEASIDFLLRRYERYPKLVSSRPLFKNYDSVFDAISNLYNTRHNKYQSLADFSVNVDKLNREQIVWQIIDKLAEYKKA